MPGRKTLWHVTPSRLMVESTDVQENCGEAIRRVVEKLPYTPLAAIGSNFIFEGDDEFTWEEMGEFGKCSKPDLPRGYRESAAGNHLSIERNEIQYNLKVVKQDRKVELSVNVHAGLRGKDVNRALEVAGNFKNHREAAHRLVSRIFHVEIVK